MLCNWSEFRLHSYASPPSWSELPWPDQTIQLLVGVLLCSVWVWCDARLTHLQTTTKKRDILLFYLKHSSCHQLNPSCIFPSFSTSFTLFFFLNCLLKSTHAVTPLPPLFFFFFAPPSPTSGYLVVYEWRWGKQQVWPAAPNTREAIQFRVGSKLCGHLRAARLRRSGAWGGVEHVVPKNECDDLQIRAFSPSNLPQTSAYTLYVQI